MSKTVLSFFTSFIPGLRLIDGGELQTLANELFSTQSGITALAGGGQVGATALKAALCEVDTVASDNDSVMLPLALPGTQVTIVNAGAHSLQVYGQSADPNNAASAGDTIAAHNSNNQSATGTGVAQASAVIALYVCVKTGQWKQFITA